MLTQYGHSRFTNNLCKYLSNQKLLNPYKGPIITKPKKQELIKIFRA